MAVTGRVTPYSLPAASAIPRSLWCNSTRKPGSKECSSIFSRLTSMTLFPASPPPSTSRIFSGETPALEPSTSASETASMVSATTIWLAAFTTCPVPTDPTWVTVFPMTSKSGSTRSKSSSLPPTMMERVPSMAPTSPPLTGASSIEAPRSWALSANSSVTTGEIVLISTTRAPSLTPSSTPSSPASTSSTCGESGSMVMMMSDCSATVAPSSSSAFSRVRLYATRSWPASMRFSAIGLPMIPSPMKPTVSAMSLPFLGSQIRHRNVTTTQLSGQPGEAFLGRIRGWVVLQTDVAFVAEPFQLAEDERVVDLPRAGLPTARRVGDLDVPDQADVLAKVGHEVPLHPLHVIEVVLNPYVLPAHVPDEFHGLLRRAQQIRPVLEGVDGLYHDGYIRRLGLRGGEADVLARQGQLFVAAHAGDLVSHECVQPLASQRAGEIQGHGHVLPEPRLTFGIPRQSPVSARHITGVEVEEHGLHACIFDGLFYLCRILIRRPPERARREARLSRLPEPVQERNLFEKYGNVRTEPHGTLLP